MVLKDQYSAKKDVAAKIRRFIRATLGPIYVPDEIHIVSYLPRTRSGKIMRRVVKAVAVGEIPGDIITLENSASIEEIRAAIDRFTKEK